MLHSLFSGATSVLRSSLLTSNPLDLVDFLQGAYLLIGLVGVGILLPLIIIVIYLSQSSKYTGNHIMHATLGNFYHLMKPALAPRWVDGELIHERMPLIEARFNQQPGPAAT